MNLEKQTPDTHQILTDAFHRYAVLIGTADAPEEWGELCAADRKEHSDMIMSIGGDKTPVFDDNDCTVLMVSITGLSAEICLGFILGFHHGLSCEKDEPDSDGF